MMFFSSLRSRIFLTSAMLTVLSIGGFAVSWSIPATNLVFLQAYYAQWNALGPN